MDWWLFAQSILLCLCTYILVVLAYALMNPLIVLLGIPFLLVALLVDVYFFYGRDKPAPQAEAQPACVCDAENIAARAWAEYGQAEQKELEGEA